MIQYLRSSVRAILKRPGFAAMAMLTLAIGIGVTSAVFSLVQGVLLTPPPYQDPEQLVLVSPFKQDGTQFAERGWVPEEWLDWQRNAKSFQSIAAYDWTFNFLVRPDGSESLEGMAVTRNYFRVTGLKPMLGRVFSESEATYKTKAGDHHRLQSVAAKIQFGSRGARENDSDQPLGHATPSHWSDAAGHSVSAVANRGARAEVQSKCTS